MGSWPSRRAPSSFPPTAPATPLGDSHRARQELELWWNRHRLTGDNLKERPYTNLHARLTTRSNTFLVHVHAQTLQKSRSTDPAQCDEGRDAVLATWRGSALVSRKIRADEVPDYPAADAGSTTPSVDHCYSWSITHLRAFTGR